MMKLPNTHEYAKHGNGVSQATAKGDHRAGQVRMLSHGLMGAKNMHDEHALGTGVEEQCYGLGDSPFAVTRATGLISSRQAQQFHRLPPKGITEPAKFECCHMA